MEAHVMNHIATEATLQQKLLKSCFHCNVISIARFFFYCNFSPTVSHEFCFSFYRAMSVDSGVYGAEELMSTSVFFPATTSYSTVCVKL